MFTAFPVRTDSSQANTILQTERVSSLRIRRLSFPNKSRKLHVTNKFKNIISIWAYIGVPSQTLRK